MMEVEDDLYVHLRLSSCLIIDLFDVDEMDDIPEAAYDGGAVDIDVRVEDIMGTDMLRRSVQ